MKFNAFILLFPAALLACWWIVRDFEGQSTHTFFGIAESEPRILNFDRDVEVRFCAVKKGDLVKRGDTLAVFSQRDLDIEEAEYTAELSQIESESTGNHEILAREAEVSLAEHRVTIAELRDEIRVLETEDSLQMAFRKSIYPDLPIQKNSVVQEKIQALRHLIAEKEVELEKKLSLRTTEQKANKGLANLKKQQKSQQVARISQERTQLFLIAPFDGYIEDLYFFPNSLIPAHRDLLKINPQIPNSVLGFINESASVTFILGQEVLLSSHTRPEVRCTGKIIGSNPKMTELPLRLRKFIEVRSWGREIFIQLPDSNQFFISEKIVITIPQQNQTQ